MNASCPPCHHLHPTGNRCGSPALRGQQFCFYHHPTRRPPPPAGRKPRLPAFHIPTLADRTSIQRALAKIVSRVVSGRLDRATARLMLVAMQLVERALPGDSRQQAALIRQIQRALKVPSFRPLADLLSSIRPPRPTHKKCTESKPNHCRTIT